MSLLEQKCEGLCAPVEVEEAQCGKCPTVSTGADNEQRGDRGRFHQHTNLDANPRTATRFQGTEQHPGVR